MNRLVAALKVIGGAGLLVLGGCALWQSNGGPGVNVVQDSDYCGTPTPEAAMRYFGSPEPFGDWITDRDIRELRPSAASLTGVLVVELGQRPSDGYSFAPMPEATRIEDDTLYLGMRWDQPEIDDHVAQVLISPCVVIPRPQGRYSRVVLVDQLGKQRGEVKLPENAHGR